MGWPKDPDQFKLSDVYGNPHPCRMIRRLIIEICPGAYVMIRQGWWHHLCAVVIWETPDPDAVSGLIDRRLRAILPTTWRNYFDVIYVEIVVWTPAEVGRQLRGHWSGLRRQSCFDAEIRRYLRDHYQHMKRETT